MVDTRGKGRKRGTGASCVRMAPKEKTVLLGREEGGGLGK